MNAIAIGADQAGFDLKEKLKDFLIGLHVEVDDYGVFGAEPEFYSNTAVKVAQAIADGRYQRGILVCGTGVRMAISADKVSGVKAMVCHDLNSLERALKNDPFQIMVLGARIVGEELAKGLMEAWLKLADTEATAIGNDNIQGLPKCRERLSEGQSHPGVGISP